MPNYEYSDTLTGKTVELYRKIDERDDVPPHLKRIVAPNIGGPGLMGSSCREPGVDEGVPKAFREMELQGHSHRQICKEAGFSRDHIRRVWNFAFVLTCLLAAGCAHVTKAADLSAGYIFTDTDHVTASKLNSVVGDGTINSAFITAKSAATPAADGSDQLIVSQAGTLKRLTLATLRADTNWITSQAEDTSPATNDYVLAYDTSANALKKVALTNLTKGFVLSFSCQSNIASPTIPTINVLHGLGGTPQIARAVLVVTVATNHLSVGDEIELTQVRQNATADPGQGRPVASLIVSSTNAILGGFDTTGGSFDYQSKDGNGIVTVTTNSVAAKIYLYRFQ